MLLESIRATRDALPTLRAPDLLRARIRGDVARSARAAPRGTHAWLRITVAASFVAVAALAFIGGRFGGVRRDADMRDLVLNAHLRSLQPNHLTDVVSTDQHTVKPWFAGKLDFSPTVIALDSAGFPLIGGRLDYLGDRPVAALVYGRRLHTISVLTWPAGRGEVVAPKLDTKNGYNVAHWTARGMTYWVVSDVAADDLRAFCALLRDKIEAS